MNNDKYSNHEEPDESSKEHAGETLYPRLPNYNAADSNVNAKYMQQNYISNQPPPYYDELDHSGTYDGSRFGLIRGYHQQMYEPLPQQRQCCDCSGAQSKPGSQDAKCNWGIICGILLLILGILALIMGFTLPQKTPSFEDRQKLTPEELKDFERIEYYVEIFIFTGLSVLSVGGIVISVGILYPLCRKGRETYEESVLSRYYASEVYVKQDDELQACNKQVVNYKDVLPSDVTLRKIQPEREVKEPIDKQTGVFKEIK